MIRTIFLNIFLLLFYYYYYIIYILLLLLLLTSSSTAQQQTEEKKEEEREEEQSPTIKSKWPIDNSIVGVPNNRVKIPYSTLPFVDKHPKTA